MNWCPLLLNEQSKSMAKIHIELIYATPKQQDLREMQVEQGTTLWEAIEQSGLLSRFPEIDRKTVEIGIFSKIKSRDTLLREGDRVEIYRPLLIDPKDARRKR